MSSVPEKSVRCSEVSAIEDVHYKKVSLYDATQKYTRESFLTHTVELVLEFKRMR